MESNYSNRDFERYVQQNADQYRMFPSEKVWKGVHSALHTRRKWYGFGLAFLLLLTGGAVTLVMKSYPSGKKQDNAAINANLPFSSAPEKTNAVSPSDIKELLSLDRKSSATPSKGPLFINSQARSVLSIPVNPVSGLSTVVDPATDELADQPLLVRMQQPGNSIVDHSNTQLNRKASKTADTDGMVAAAIPAIAAVSNWDQPAAPATQASQKNETLQYQAPYSIEDVTFRYKAPPARVSWQLFFTPTVSYRKLSQNNEFTGAPGNSIYPFASLEDVNNAVTHKPDFGFQLGVMARYPVSKSLKIRGGLQFNVNRYDIKAFSYPVEQAVINLDGGNNSSVSTWTRYRSQSGYKSDWLKNFYFSVSVPVGAELTLFTNKKTSVGIAGTIQPTYVISDRAYLISTDYKNYAKVPWLIRHVNMSTGFETFVNYSKGKTQWQVGPQVRYQLLSSFQNKYPVKENLFDFGIKLGVTLNNH